MKYSGPVGLPRLTSVGPLVSSTGETPTQVERSPQELRDDGVTREQFIEECKNSEWADGWAEGLLESLNLDGTINDEEELKTNACEEIADDIGLVSEEDS